MTRKHDQIVPYIYIRRISRPCLHFWAARIHLPGCAPGSFTRDRFPNWSVGRVSLPVTLDDLYKRLYQSTKPKSTNMENSPYVFLVTGQVSGSGGP